MISKHSFDSSVGTRQRSVRGSDPFFRIRGGVTRVSGVPSKNEEEILKGIGSGESLPMTEADWQDIRDDLRCRH